MIQSATVTLLLLSFFASAHSVGAQTELRDALKDSVGTQWIYDDFQQAQARAKESGKPLLVMFRCVP